MLGFLAGRELVAAGRHNRRLPDSFPAAEGGERRIRERRARGHQFLMDSHEIAFALREQLEDLLAERHGFLVPLDLRYGAGARLQHLANALPRDLQQPRNLALPHPLRMQLENRGSLSLTQHGWFRSPGFVVGVRSASRWRVGSCVVGPRGWLVEIPADGALAGRWR